MTLTWGPVRAYIGAMLHLIPPRIVPVAAFAICLAAPLQAQSQVQSQAQSQNEAQPQNETRNEAETDQGRSLMERGAELFMEGLTREMAPALQDLRGLAEQFGPSMQGFFEEMGPAFAGILDQVKDWSNYHPPEILPNGDIIMRRKLDPKDEAEPELPPAGPTDI